MHNIQSIKIMDNSPGIGNKLLVISVYTLHFVVTPISQHGKIYLDNSLQIQYYLAEDNGIPATLHSLFETSYWKIQADVQKSFTTVRRVCLQ
jgi:hypothetical protein